MSEMEATISAARDAFASSRWTEAFQLLSQVADGSDPGDVEKLAIAAYMTGADEEAQVAWGRAHSGFQRNEDHGSAARCAFWLGWTLFLKGEEATSSGWFARAKECVDRAGGGVEEGYLLLPTVMRQLAAEDAEGVSRTAGQIAAAAERYQDDDLRALGRLSAGEAMIIEGDLPDGTRVFDEVMVSVVAGEVSPWVAGLIYCAVLIQCRKIFDVQRAREWTDSLTRWCDSNPGLVPFRGQCMVHRSEILMQRGDWDRAEQEATEACAWLGREPAAGDALYQKAELLRLRGDLGAAEDAFRAAATLGADPHPGLSQVWCRLGRAEEAASALERGIESTFDPCTRARMLIPAIEIFLAAGKRQEAADAAERLADISDRLGVKFIEAHAHMNVGLLKMYDGQYLEGLTSLRQARSMWQALGAPYEMARARSAIATALRALGDEESAAIESSAAEEAFRSLGAEPDLVGFLGIDQQPPDRRGLTRREVEVLVEASRGKSNKEIAVSLSISEHTVRRHLQNIFSKIGVSSRAGATAFAFKYGLVNETGT